MIAIRHFLAYLIYLVSFLFPRSSRTIVYGGAKDCFIDNTKYCFIYANKHMPLYKHIWLTKRRDVKEYLSSLGYTSCMSNSILGIYIALRSRHYIFDSQIGDFAYNFLSGGAVTCNLWHGIPLKKIGFDNVISENSAYGRNRFERLLNRKSVSPDYLLCPSDDLRQIFLSAFKVSSDSIVVGGYYRNLPFYMSQDELDAFIQESGERELIALQKLILQGHFERVVIYMPTFRDADPDFLLKAVPDFDRLNSVCQTQGILLLFKMHRATKVSTNFSSYSNLVWVDSKIDIYPILPYTHMLVTDYSSIFFDYALLNKPVLFYSFDLDCYQTKSRELYFKFDNIVGQSAWVQTFDGLLRALGTISEIENREIMFFDKPCEFDEILYKSLSIRG